ncbi:MAG: hypothetical protein GXY67_05175 [Clostridiales bacterium]|nr:hypothetical protein [Clostridiales bacterium]
MTSLQRIIGMPVVGNGKTLGFVERGVLSKSGKRLQGLVIRRGLGSARWVPRRAISMIGSACVLVCGEATHLPKEPEVRLTRVFLTSGESAGMVTDALIHGETFQVTALEVSDGPLYRLLGRKAYATAYRLRPEESADGGDTLAFEIITSGLHSWVGLPENQRKGEEG